jgi:uncharacterized protein (DUF4415 family)
MIEKHNSGTSEWVDSDDAPALTDAFFDRAEIARNGHVVRRGRPPAERPKERITLRLDADVVQAFRDQGSGWQTRINAALRAAAHLDERR